MGPSTVREAITSVARALYASYSHVLQLPQTMEQIKSIMDGFEQIAGIPHCAGAIDGTHIPWKNCSSAQYFEYRC